MITSTPSPLARSRANAAGSCEPRRDDSGDDLGDDCPSAEPRRNEIRSEDSGEGTKEKPDELRREDSCRALGSRQLDGSLADGSRDAAGVAAREFAREFAREVARDVARDEDGEPMLLM